MCNPQLPLGRLKFLLVLAALGFAALLSGCASPSVSAVQKPVTPPQVVRGVDLSKWQGEVDFAGLRSSGITYVFVKATQGSAGTDSRYSLNLQAARCASLSAGSYHFFVTGETAQAQFAHFSATASVLSGDLPPVVDIEVLHNNDDAGLATELASFLALLEHRYRVKPIIYSGRSFANRYLKGFATYPLWLADYSTADMPTLPLDWTNWTFWQYGQHGSVSGVDGPVDLDRFNGDLTQFKGFLVPPQQAADPGQNRGCRAG